MKVFVSAMLMLLSLTGFSSPTAVAPVAETKTIQTTTPAAGGPIILSADNTVAFSDVFDQLTLAPVLQKLMELDQKLPAGQPLYLVLNSPGGEIVAGINFINALQGLSRPITTITIFSASMAFITVQSLGQRIIMPNGVLMSHRAAGGVEGQFPGEIDTQYKFWKRYIDKIQGAAAERMGLTNEQLLAKHYDQLWLTGSDAVDAKAADKVSLIRCDSSLIGTEEVDKQVMMFSVHLTMSKCPLVTAPLKIALGGLGGENQEESTKETDAAKKEVEQFIHELYTNKQSFMNHYIDNGSYKKFMNH